LIPPLGTANELATIDHELAGRGSLEAWGSGWWQRSFSWRRDLHAHAKPPQSADEKTIDASVRFAK